MAVRLSAHTVDINAGTLDGVTIGGSVKGAVSTSALIADTADINGGTVDNVIIGGSTPLAGSFTTLSASSGLDSTIIGANTAAAGSFTTGDFSGNTTLKDVTVGVDGTYGGVYRTMGFSGNANGSTRIFATTDDSDALHLAAGTGRGVKIWVNGTTATAFEVDASSNATFSGNATAANLNVLSGSFNHQIRPNGDGLIIDADSNSTGGSGADIRLLVKGSEKARLDSAGALFVSTTAQPTASNFGTAFARTGSAGLIESYRNTGATGSVANIGGTAGNMLIKGDGDLENTNNAYTGISDVKLKENIVDTSPKLEKLQQVRVVNYNLIQYPDRNLLGVVAQELEQIFPGLVKDSPDLDEDGNDLGTVTKSVKYSVFVPMLIKAMQEQQAIIDALTARIEALEA